MTRGGRIVYSTDDPPGKRRDRAAPSHRPPSRPAQPPGVKPGVVYVEVSRKGRGGKTVTLVLNLPGGEADKAALLKDLKTACGAGGTLKDGNLELQGDHREAVIARLRALGHTVKPRGG